MSVIYVFIKATATQPGGIVMVEASPAAVRAIAELGQPTALELKAIVDSTGNAQSAVDYLKSAIGNDLATTIKTIGSVAAGLAVGEMVAFGVAAGIATFVAAPYALLIGAIIGVTVGGAAGQKIYDEGWEAANNIGQIISDLVNRDYTTARGWVARDPLVLDLDGDGIETVGINPLAPVLFDHDADGVRTGTGWVASDDGLLVIDVNGNGVIDSGRELFGDNTLLPTTVGGAPVFAINGYQALWAQDSNHDGQVNNLDASYTQLRVWRDLNQDGPSTSSGQGVSQAGELQTLGQAGIASIDVAGTTSNTNLAVITNGCAVGNTQIASGSFTRSNGTTGQSGATELTGSLLLTGTNRRYLFSSCSRNYLLIYRPNRHKKFLSHFKRSRVRNDLPR